MSYTENIRGSIPALVTPFTASGEIDLQAFKNLVKWHVDNGTHGLVICGTTGESPNISDEEHSLLIKTAIDTAPVGFPIIAGCGSNSTNKTIKLTQNAQALGAAAALIVVPYYNKPSQQGLYAHFEAVHDATNLPIILYNVPSRTIVDMSDDTVIALTKLPRIIGIKDATGDLNRLRNQKAHIEKDFIYLSGDDMSALEYILNGGHGCISVTANVVPEICASIFNNAQIGKIEEAKEQDNKLSELHKKMFIEPSPAAPKYLLSKQGHIQNTLRLPLLPLSSESANIVEETLKQSIKNGD
ncbi:MAG: 4-hydroxy-tetrahydrodipicolinate synthase [Alphaproteobacteria bacterium]|nr:4-hydroxy-tetrahydrodipicolinate synthase [Alphaproteobacteria bacterium]